MKKLLFILLACFVSFAFADISDECRNKTKDECLSYLSQKCDENNCEYCQKLITSLNVSFVATQNLTVNFDTKQEKEIKLEKLKTKQGKIAAKQRKIVNKATEQKLREYLGRINTKDIERQNKNEEKIAKRDEEIDKLNTERETLGEIKGNLLGDKSLISKGLGIKVAFNEKLTQARINRLKAKRGILKFRSRHMIQANVNKNLIARMKDKVVRFGKALGESIKSGIAGFKETYEKITFYLVSLFCFICLC